MQSQIGTWSQRKNQHYWPSLYLEFWYFCITWIFCISYFFSHNVALNTIHLDTEFFRCPRQLPPSLHPNPGPDSTLQSLCPTVTEDAPPWSPGLRSPYAKTFSTTPECQESSWGWHLISAVYFCACPSATDKMLHSVELMCWNGECQCQVVCVIGYLHSWPRKGA